MGIGLYEAGSDEYWMRLALEQARSAAAVGEVPVGAVLVRGDELLASGFNRPISTHDPTAHAEITVLRKAAAQLSNYRLPGTTLYVTIEPCAMCAGALVHARVARLVYGATEPRAGAVHSHLEILGHAHLNHIVEVCGGVLADESAKLMREFFADRR